MMLRNRLATTTPFSHAGVGARLAFLVTLAAGCSRATARDGSATVTPDYDVALSVVGKDTLHSVSGQGYAASATVRSVAVAAKTALDGAAREWRRYYNVDPALVRLRIDTLVGRAEVLAVAAYWG